jgi:hypothetical protein
MQRRDSEIASAALAGISGGTLAIDTFALSSALPTLPARPSHQQENAMTLLFILAHLLAVLLRACSFAAGPRVERVFGPAFGLARAIAVRSGNLHRARIYRPQMPTALPFGFFPFKWEVRWLRASIGPP